MDKGDVAWMIVATILVLLMIVPGLALFYGGLVRAKNMLVGADAVLRHHLRDDDRLGRLRLQPGAERRRGARRLHRRLLAAVPRGRHRRLDGRDLHRRRGDPRVHLHLLPDDLRLHHPGADRRRLRRADEVLGGAPVLRPVVDLRLHADRPHGLVRRRPALQHGRARLRRRHGGAHQRRHRGAGRLPGARAAHRLPARGDAAAQPGA